MSEYRSVKIEPSLKPNIWRKEVGLRKTAEAPCAVASGCGLCPKINEDYRESLGKKIEEITTNLQGMEGLSECRILALKEANTVLGYRTHAKVRLKFSEESPGLSWHFLHDQHSQNEIKLCPLHHPRLRDFISDFDKILRLPDFFERARRGLKCLSVRLAYLTEEMMLTFFVSEIDRPFLKEICEAAKELGHRIVSVYASKNDAVDELFSAELQLVSGVQRLRVSLCGLSFETTPGSNFPVNPWMSEKLYRRFEQLAGELGSQAHRRVAWSLYASVGVGALLLARSGYQVFGVDQNSQAMRDAQSNALRNDLQDRLYFMPSSVEDLKGQIPDWAWKPSLIYVKSPRGGITPFAARFLGEMLASNPGLLIIFHVKDLQGLKANLEVLKAYKGQARQIEPFDVFPYTENMEFLCIVSQSLHT